MAFPFAFCPKKPSFSDVASIDRFLTTLSPIFKKSITTFLRGRLYFDIPIEHTAFSLLDITVVQPNDNPGRNRF